MALAEFQKTMLRNLDKEQLFQVYLVSLQMNDFDTADYIKKHYYVLFTKEQKAQAGALVEELMKKPDGSSPFEKEIKH